MIFLMNLPDDAALLGVSRRRVDRDEQADGVLGAAQDLGRLQHHRVLPHPQELGHVARLEKKETFSYLSGLGMVVARFTLSQE